MPLSDLVKLVPESLAALKKGIRAYHGSPHDFDKFDIERIGTGEGAQAYGHGLYFAENEAVAKAYRETLSQDKDRFLDNGGRLPAWLARTLEQAPRYHDEAVDMFTKRINEAKEEAKTSVQPWLYPGKIEGLEGVLKSIHDVHAGVPIKPAGRMYEVNINAEPKQFLDWDRRIASPDAMEQFAAKFDASSPTTRKMLEDWSYGNQQRGMPLPSGQDVVRELGGVDGIKARQVSRTLNEAGIPGIKYLDEGSRVFGDAERIMEKYGTQAKALEVAQERLASASTGMGSSPGMRSYWSSIVSDLSKPQTSNFVLFNDSLIDIARKYALPGMVGSGVAGGAMQGPGPAPATY